MLLLQLQNILIILKMIYKINRIQYKVTSPSLPGVDLKPNKNVLQSTN